MLNRRLHYSLKCIAMHRIYINDMNICKHLSVQNDISRSVYTFKVLASLYQYYPKFYFKVGNPLHFL